MCVRGHQGDGKDENEPYPRSFGWETLTGGAVPSSTWLRQFTLETKTEPDRHVLIITFSWHHFSLCLYCPVIGNDSLGPLLWHHNDVTLFNLLCLFELLPASSRPRYLVQADGSNYKPVQDLHLYIQVTPPGDLQMFSPIPEAVGRFSTGQREALSTEHKTLVFRSWPKWGLTDLSGSLLLDLDAAHWS